MHFTPRQLARRIRRTGERIVIERRLAMPKTQITIDRDAAINNIAFLLYQRDMLKLPPPQDASSRLEPFLTLSPVVGVIADAMDDATVRRRPRNGHGHGSRTR